MDGGRGVYLRERSPLVCALGLGLLVACGSDGPGTVSAVPAGEGSGSGGSGRSGGSGGAGGGAGAGDRDAGASQGDAGPGGSARDGGPRTTGSSGPLVEIEAPLEARDPNDDEVITEPFMTVRCRVSQGAGTGSSPVDESSVAIRLVAAEGLVDPIEAAINLVSAGLYEGSFALAGYGNGPLDIECSASDLAAEPVRASAARRVLLDRGPTITFLEPGADSVHALELPVALRFVVEPAPINGSDAEADVVQTTLQVSGVSFDVTEDPDQPGMYSLSVDFDDRALFPMAPSTARFTVSATNARTPEPVTRSRSIDIELDAAGPVITVSSPTHLSLVRGDVQLQVNITDPSGVDQDSVYGTINLGLHELTAWRVSGDTYTERFDTLSFGATLTQLTINISARDRVGNESIASHILRLDNVPPVLELDPPLIREFMEMANGTVTCSEYYDPVGNRATNDGDIVPASSLYRVMIWERTNMSPGQGALYPAGTNPNAVELFAQGDVSIPLLVDTSGDGICDNVNADMLPLADRPVKVQLAAVNPRGSPFYYVMTDLDAPAHDAPSYCQVGTATMQPTPLCPFVAGEGLYRIPASTIESRPPAIFAISPTNSGMGECAGITWELLPIVGAGWACLAARAEDNIGNVGVSKPLRVCLDDGVGPADCDPSTQPWPDCTDGCQLPAGFADYYGPSLMVRQ